MTPLKISLLGRPEITFDQQPLTFSTQKSLALLIFLVVEGGMHSRSWLMALLWPERSSEKANITLRSTLSRLRKSLRPAGEFLISEAGKVGFDFAKHHEIDLLRLATAVQPEIDPHELAVIMTLDRGEFLEGFTLPDAPEFDTWSALQREICQRQVETVYDRFSQHLLATHDSAAAVSAATRWVARAPLNEQAYRRLMAAQALHGQRPSALQTYNQLHATLQKELGLEPSRETAVLADNISMGRVDREHPGPRPIVTAPSTEIRGRRLRLPLVGRSAEHNQLVAAFRQASQDTQLVALIGAAGAGKTRLVSTFQEWAMLDSPDVELWQGRAFETGGKLAYQPVVEAFRSRLEQVNAPEDLLEDVWLAELSQLMPELRARYPDLPPPLSGDAYFVRARLFEAVSLLGNALTSGRTAVLLLDDMQWADTDTLDLIHYLARRWTEMGAPVLLLLLIRQEAYAADAALREWLASLGRDAPMTRLLLDNLNGAAVEQLINHLAGGRADKTITSAFAAWLWSETRGLPFFIEALLQMLVEQKILPRIGDSQPVYDFAAAMDHVRSVAQVPLPPGVREVIRARLAQHSQDEGALLLAAAVLGRTSTFDRLCQVANLPETSALEALGVLLNDRLLLERPSHRRPYTLAHDYIREVVYSESHEARRRVFHRRALLALEAADAPAAECAFHALAALLDEPAFRYSVAAGHEAFTAYATIEALSHFNTAHDLIGSMQQRGEPLDTNLLALLYQERGQALVLLSDDEAVQSNYDAMRSFAVQRQDRTMELAALLSLSDLYGQYTSLFNPLKAREMAQEALALARDLGDKAAEARSLWGLMIVEVTAIGDNNLGMSYGRQALALARELGLKELVGHILNGLWGPYLAQNQIEQALEALREAQLIWRELGNLQRLAEASRFMAIITNGIGDHRRILAEAPQLVDLGASISSRFDVAQASTYLAIAHARQGRFAQALQYTERVGALSAAINHPMEEHIHQYVRIELYLAAGAWAEADQWAGSLYAQREAMVPATVHLNLAFVALAWIVNEKLDEGQALLDELVPTLPANNAATFVIILIAIAYGHLRLAQGKPEALFAGLEERLRPFREAGNIRVLADEYWLRGRAEMALGNCDAAREALLKAREAAAAQEERAVLWQILATLSKVERARGHEAAADSFLDQAREVVNYIVEHAGELRETFLAWPQVQAVLERPQTASSFIE